ncbi:hypothetical protein CGLO_09303 [Colletotrichum gloeosporioides Cg-14]|uniref:Uncharacterized protein n=1 Tax=Colletotrichum gloeosporioides (strain Cg-14) TaxID=1237896 RepID=T0LSH1_COLGC|nr:hypothetical protein CGLO_09303 [Colletotrichum gloeosporioides Cg-14]
MAATLTFSNPAFFKCNESSCHAKYFSTSSNLKRHMRSKHGPKVRMACGEERQNHSSNKKRHQSSCSKCKTIAAQQANVTSAPKNPDVNHGRTSFDSGTTYCLPVSKPRKRHSDRDSVPNTSDNHDSDGLHKKARRDDAGDEEHQHGTKNLPAVLEGEDVPENKQQKEEVVGPIDDVDDRVFMVQRLYTGIDRQLHALNENLSNPESTLITTLSSAATTAIQQSLKGAPVEKLQQEMSQCKQLLVRKQRHFEELRRSSQKEQNEQADALRSVQTQVAGLSKQLEKERNKLAKVSASLQAEETKGTEVSCSL